MFCYLVTNNHGQVLSQLSDKFEKEIGHCLPAVKLILVWPSGFSETCVKSVLLFMFGPLPQFPHYLLFIQGFKCQLITFSVLLSLWAI